MTLCYVYKLTVAVDSVDTTKGKRDENIQRSLVYSCLQHCFLCATTNLIPQE